MARIWSMRPRGTHAGIVVWLVLVISMLTLEGSRATQPGAAHTVSVACSNAVQAFLNGIRDEFQRQTGHDLRFSCGLASSVRERIRAGDALDVVILTPALLDELAASGRIAPGSRTLLGRSPVALAQRAGLPKRSMQSVEELQAVLAATSSIAFAQQGVSGTAFMALLRRWNVTESFASRLRPLEDGAAVAAAVARGDADLGVLPVSEIVSVGGVEVAGVLPRTLDAYVVMEAAAVAGTADAPHVKAFMRFLASPGAVGALKRHGFETAGEPR
jgi:molybdate transport system substrate-binding protein